MKFFIVALAVAAMANPMPEQKIPPIPDIPQTESGDLLVKDHPNAGELKGEKKPEDIIPMCAIPCIGAYVQKHTRCKADDYSCICNHKEVRDKEAVVCVINGCGYTKAKSMFPLRFLVPC